MPSTIQHHHTAELVACSACCLPQAFARLDPVADLVSMVGIALIRNLSLHGCWAGTIAGEEEVRDSPHPKGRSLIRDYTYPKSANQIACWPLGRFTSTESVPKSTSCLESHTEKRSLARACEANNAGASTESKAKEQ
ncbi:hypothetical protein ONS96_000387 [Cadophora gregata f. sp. sojae]|nr:hypothetical protein ONS96_000387 [Cadophora gregata f. sp. sojae]